MSARAPIRLRAHHLWCVLTFVGAGYTPAFTAHMRQVIARLAAGAPAVLVEGPDDLCAPLRATRDDHCRLPRVRARDARARVAAEGVLGRALAPGATLTFTPETTARLRAAYAAGAAARACAGCPWTGFCAEVVARGFAGALLADAARTAAVTPPPPPPDAPTPARASALSSDTSPPACETSPASRNQARPQP